MSVQLQMFDLKTCDASPNATSLPELEDGPTLLGSQEFQTTTHFGLDHVHANRFQPLEGSLDPTTSGICGRPGSTSLKSVNLQRSLESRLRAGQEDDGCSKHAVKWSPWAMGSGLWVWMRAAQARTITAIGFGLLPTPQASDNRNRGDISMPCIQRRMRLGKQIGLSMLFKGTPCPMCVGSMMGYPREWLNALSKALLTPSFLKSEQSSSKLLCKPLAI
jgi:hypothetical protein